MSNRRSTIFCVHPPPIAIHNLSLHDALPIYTAANRRFTFGVTGSRNALRDQVGGLVAFAIGLVLSSGTLAAVHGGVHRDRKSTRLNSSHLGISYAVFCLKKKNDNQESVS